MYCQTIFFFIDASLGREKWFTKQGKKVIILFGDYHDYTTTLSNVKYEAKHGKRLKILTPYKMF